MPQFAELVSVVDEDTFHNVLWQSYNLYTAPETQEGTHYPSTICRVCGQLDAVRRVYVRGYDPALGIQALFPRNRRIANLRRLELRLPAEEPCICASVLSPRLDVCYANAPVFSETPRDTLPYRVPFFSAPTLDEVASNALGAFLSTVCYWHTRSTDGSSRERSVFWLRRGCHIGCMSWDSVRCSRRYYNTVTQ